MRRTSLGTGLAGLASTLLSACSPLALLNVASDGGAERVPDLAYGAHPRQRLDLYRPRDGRGPWPVVGFFYGGAWEWGARGDYRFVGHALASQGWMVAVADYRLHPEVAWPAFLQDGAAAVRWLVDHAADHGGDARGLHLMGHSAGAYNAAMLALDARWLRAVDLDPATALRSWVGLSGPYDFLPLKSDTLKTIFGPDRPTHDRNAVAGSRSTARSQRASSASIAAL
jgi:acetyl esterase/lipase